MPDKTLYELLQVGSDAGPESIRAAYLQLSSRLDPDSEAHRGDPDVRMRYAALKEAYLILSNEQRRRRYDESLRVRRLQAPDAASEPGSTFPRALLLSMLALGGGVYYVHDKLDEACLIAKAEADAARQREAQAIAAAQAERERLELERAATPGTHQAVLRAPSASRR